MPKADTNGIQLHYQIHGQGHPLLLIAGVGYGAWFWEKIIPGLAEHYQVIAFDNRGAGKSDKPEGPYTVSMMAEDTIGLLETLEIKDVYLLGHSLGGFIAQEVVVQQPDLVSKLILASTNFGGTKVIPITPEALEVLTSREGDPVELVQRGIKISTAPGFVEREQNVVKELTDYRFTNPVPPPQYQAQVTAGAGMAALTDEQVEKRMSGIQVPVLILFGAHDRVVPPGNAELMAEKIPDAEIKFLPEAGHIFPIEKPTETIQAVRSFISNSPG